MLNYNITSFSALSEKISYNTISAIENWKFEIMRRYNDFDGVKDYLSAFHGYRYLNEMTFIYNDGIYNHVFFKI